MPNSRDTASANWTWAKTTEHVTAAAGCATFDELKALHTSVRQTNALLGEIRNLLLGLGSDGIHEVLRHHRGVARRAQARIRTRTKRRQAQEGQQP